MNREIKFRAWDGETFLYFDLNEKWEEINLSYLLLFNRLDKQQYTGLKDKQGKEIYEGDILKGVSNNEFSKGDVNNYEVIWGQDSWHIIGTFFSLQKLINYCNNNIEVIGNIFENPKLHSRH